jgi:tetratricopeptide (TPR) repeat protein
LRRKNDPADAEPLFRRSLAINEKSFGPDHPKVAIALNNLAVLYFRQGKYSEVEPLFKRALAINEKKLGPDHPEVATDLSNLASTYIEEGKYRRCFARYALCPPHWEPIRLYPGRCSFLFLERPKYRPRGG